jgi:predicted ArsR family transcriptional regulator
MKLYIFIKVLFIINWIQFRSLEKTPKSGRTSQKFQSSNSGNIKFPTDLGSETVSIALN